MKQRIFALLALIVTLLSAACQNQGAAIATPETAPLEGGQVAAATSRPPVIATNTPIPPTPTPTEPLAALVNGEPIFLADFEREMARFQAAQTEPSADPAGDGEQVLNALIERALILQSAAADDVTVSPETVDQQLADLRAAAADAGGFEEWLRTNQWTEEEFRQTLEAELIIGEVVTRVTADVPTTMEQVRASYIQMDDATLAQSVLDRARAGDDFAFLAQQNSVDRVTGENGGDLGFFAPGGLLVPEVEAAAFALQPGEISDLIAVTAEDGTTTYYIVKLTEREPDRPLTADARYQLLQAAFEEWLNTLWGNAVIERFVP
jgi:parvulin-like peptidyl-prolyl isomerase